MSSQWRNRPITIVPVLLCVASGTLVLNQFTSSPFPPTSPCLAAPRQDTVWEGCRLHGSRNGQQRMDDVRARFRVRIQMHIRDGWEVVPITDEPSRPLSALVTKIAIGQPRATGKGVAEQSGLPQRYCRRITVNRAGVIRVSKVACPPALMLQAGRDAGMRA